MNAPDPKPNKVYCASCGASIDQPSETPVKERIPCPACGSTARNIRVEVSETLELHEMLGFKKRSGAAGKVAQEGLSGDDLHRKSGKWMHKERTIDREKNLYKEVVTDPETGEIVHRCEEPLSQHRGHGTPKKKKRI